MSLTAGADLKYGGASVGAKFDWGSSTKKNKIIAKSQQLYCTIDMDTPVSRAAVFSASNTLEALQGESRRVRVPSTLLVSPMG